MTEKMVIIVQFATKRPRRFPAVSILLHSTLSTSASMFFASKCVCVYEGVCEGVGSGSDRELACRRIRECVSFRGKRDAALGRFPLGLYNGWT